MNLLDAERTGFRELRQDPAVHPLLGRDRIEDMPEAFLRAIGEVFAVFDEQDSGNVSYGVEVGERWFVKCAGDPADRRPVLDHAARVALLRNAVRLAATCEHRALTRLRGVIESPAGPLIIYEWFDGELLGVPSDRRDDPASAYQRFRRLPVSTIVGVLDTIYELHTELAAAGWIASDFYDGCLLYEFASGELRVMDLDTYRDAPFTNDMGRMFGSTRFMAPEEHELGARIDHATTVFVMGRTGLVLLSDRGSPKQAAVLARACAVEREQRYGSVAELLADWRSA
jgi:serine/threonine-protein kinase